MEWRKIETAPRDGTSVLLFIDGLGEDFDQIVVGHWKRGRDYQGNPRDSWVPTHEGWSTLYLATHWMALPASPKP